MTYHRHADRGVSEEEDFTGIPFRRVSIIIFVPIQRRLNTVNDAVLAVARHPYASKKHHRAAAGGAANNLLQFLVVSRRAIKHHKDHMP